MMKEDTIIINKEILRNLLEAFIGLKQQVHQMELIISKMRNDALKER